MRARLVSNSPFAMTTACGGLVFLKSQWTAVPPHEERSAQANPDLEIETTDDPGTSPMVGELPLEPVIIAEPKPEKPAAKPAAKPKAEPKPKAPKGGTP